MLKRLTQRTSFNLSVLLNSSSTALNVILLFFEAGIASRYVTEENNGLFFVLVGIISFFMVFSDLGLKQGVTQRIAAATPEKQQALANSAINFRVLVTTLVAILLYAFRSPISNIDGYEAVQEYIIPIVLLLYAMSMDELMLSLLRGFQVHLPLSILQIVKAVLRLGATASLVLVFDMQLAALVLSWAIGFGVPAVIAYFQLPIKKSLSIDYGEILGLLRFCRPLILQRIVSFFRDHASNIIMLSLIGAEQVAAYAFAFKIPSGLQSLTEAYNNVFYPRITELRANEKFFEANQLLNSSLSSLSFFMAGIALGGFMFGNEIMTLFFGETYADIGSLFGIVLVAMHVQVINTFLGYALVGAGHPRENSIALAISTPFMLALNYALMLVLPRGVFGPAIGTITEGSALNYVFRRYAVRFKYGIDNWNYLIPSFLLGVGIISSIFLENLLDISDVAYKTWPINIAILFIYAIAWSLLMALKRLLLTSPEINRLFADNIQTN